MLLIFAINNVGKIVHDLLKYYLQLKCKKTEYAKQYICESTKRKRGEKMRSKNDPLFHAAMIILLAGIYLGMLASEIPVGASDES